MSEAASVKRCVNCSGSDFFLEEASGKLRCKNCKSYYEDFGANAADNLNELRGEHITERASQINDSKDELISLACSSCGAEITIIASEAYCRFLLKKKWRYRKSKISWQRIKYWLGMFGDEQKLATFTVFIYHLCWWMQTCMYRWMGAVRFWKNAHYWHGR